MSYAGRKVLVTGAGGFIGSHLVERLLAEGARVRALVRYTSTGSRGWLDAGEAGREAEVVQGDVRDSDNVRALMRDQEVVFHLAALIGIPYSYSAPAAYVATNVQGTLNVLQGARELGTGRVVHTSTSEVYGTARYAPIDEDHPLQGQSPYSASKIAADKLAEAYHLSFGLPVVTVRPFNTFGPRQSARAVIPTIITQCLRGGRLQLGSLTPTRDLNFVSNTVDGFLRAGQAAEAVGQTVNLGSGREITIGDLAELIGRTMGVALEVVPDEQRRRPPNSEVERLVAESSRARRLLGWQPAVSLEEGLRRTISWMEQNLGHYRPGVYAV